MSMDDLTSTSYYPLDEIKREFLKYAPAYAQDEARIAIEKITELQNQRLLGNGLYYVVLMDLVGSTKYAAEFGNKASIERIEFFILHALQAINHTNVSNISL